MGARHSSVGRSAGPPNGHAPTVASSNQTTATAAKQQQQQQFKQRLSASDKLMSSLDRRVLALVRDRYPSFKALANGSSSLMNADKKRRRGSLALGKQQTMAANSTGNSTTNSASNSLSTTTIAGEHKARASLEGPDDGDVFIYPANYKLANECQKCARDNKICNCISVELAEAFNQTTRTRRPLKTNSSATSSDSNSTSESEQLDQTPPLSQHQQQQQQEQQQNVKRMYKISIATAVIDQERNKVELLPPRLLTDEGGGGDGNQLPLDRRRQQQQQAAVTAAQGRRARAKSIPIQASEVATQTAPICESPLPPLSQQQQQQETKITATSGAMLSRNSAQLTSEQLAHRLQDGQKAAREETVVELQKSSSSSTTTTTTMTTITTTTTTIAIGTPAESHEHLELNRTSVSANRLGEQMNLQLTCNLSLGDAIKVSGGSLRLASEASAGTSSLDGGHFCAGRRFRRKNGKLFGLNRQAELRLEESITCETPIGHLEAQTQQELELDEQFGERQLDGASEAATTVNQMQVGAAREEQPERLDETTSTNLALLESPKRSIFDGASKDEILEYLEDARERVPELLIAADEVMVIGENELILVNQLEPNSPATPISIVGPLLNESAASGALSSTSVADSPASLQQEGADYLHLRAANTGQQELTSRRVTPNSAETEAALSFIKEQNSLKELDSLDSVGLLTAASSLDGANSSSLSALELLKEFTQLELTADATGSLDASQPASQSGELASSTSASASAPATSADGPPSHLPVSRLVQTSPIPFGGANSPPPPPPPVSFHRLLEPTVSSSSERSVTSSEQMTAAATADLMLHISEQVSNMLARQPQWRSLRRKSNSESSAHQLAPLFSQIEALTCMKLLQKRHSTTSTITTSTSSTTTTTTTTTTTKTASNIGSSAICSQNSRAGSNTNESLSSGCADGGGGGGGSSSSTSSSSGGADGGASSMGSSAAGSPSLSTGESGNCSAASNLFYASPALSCSSPLLATHAGHQRPQLARLNIAAAAVTPTLAMAAPPAGLALNQELNLQQRDDSGLGLEFLPSCLSPPLAPPQVTAATTSSTSQRLSVIDEQTQVATTTCNELLKRGATPPVQTSASCRPMLASGRPHAHSGHYATINRLNSYLASRSPAAGSTESMIEFQCLDCDQFIVIEQARLLRKADELRLLRETELQSLGPTQLQSTPPQGHHQVAPPPSSGTNAAARLQMDLIDRAYVAALNGLPLCAGCEKRRVERKEIISEFVDTERKYGRDLKIIHDEFYRPMQIAGLLNKEQINAIFLNLDELLMAHCRFLERLESALSEARSLGDTDLNSVHIGHLFVDSADMLHTFESYCIRQGSAACQLARLAKEKELLRIFLRVSQMENTLLRRMNLAAFLMVPVQRVTKYPLLLNRLYKVTAYHHKDREALRDARLKVELHLEHINQQTKGVNAANKIWRRISNLSAASSSGSSNSSSGLQLVGQHHGLGHNRRALISAEDIGYIKLRKSAMELLKWERDETQFIHSGRLSFAPLNEFLVKQKIKSVRYMATHALLIVLGKPNWRYRPDLIKANHDHKLLVPTSGGCGIKEAALLLFREKNGRFVACREPIFLSNCVLSNDCSLFNSELPSHGHQSAAIAQASSNPSQMVGAATGTAPRISGEFRAASAELVQPVKRHHQYDHTEGVGSRSLCSKPSNASDSSTNLTAFRPSGCTTTCTSSSNNYNNNRQQGDSISMSSLKSLPEERHALVPPLAAQTCRSYSLASALPRAPIATPLQSGATPTPQTVAAPNQTILNQLMSKVNNYHNHSSKSAASSSDGCPAKSAITNACELHKGAAGHISSPVPLTSKQQQQQLAGEQQVAGAVGQTNEVTLSMAAASQQHQAYYQHHYFHIHHSAPYGDHEESFELHERLSKESLLLRADTPLKTRYWLQMLRYHAKDLGNWRARRPGLANIMMMRSQD